MSKSTTQDGLNVNNILDTFLQSVETKLKSSLEKETEKVVKTATEDFQVAVDECKKIIFDAK